jgi:surface polysaccharide O-acyltransferase-like enzyme
VYDVCPRRAPIALYRVCVVLVVIAVHTTANYKYRQCSPAHLSCKEG